MRISHAPAAGSMYTVSTLLIATAFGLSTRHAEAANVVWDGDTDTTWSTAGNWAGGAAPVTGDLAIFNSVATNQPTVTASTPGIGLWIAPGANAPLTIGVSAGTMTLAPVTGGINGQALTSFLLEGTQSLTISGAGTLRFNSPTASTTTNVRMNSSGTLNLSTAAIDISGGSLSTVTISGNDANGQVVIGKITGDKGLLFNLAGTAVLNGTSNSRSASATVASRIVLDYGASDTTKFNDGSALTLNGAAVTLKGGAHTEVVSSLTLGGGLTTVARDGGTASLRANAITRSTSGVVNFASGTVDTDTSNNTAGIIGSWLVVDGSDWGVSSASAADTSITAYTGYDTNFATANGTTTNASLSGSATMSAAKALFTLKLNTTAASQSLNMGGFTLTLGQNGTGAHQVGGLLFVGAHDYTITNGSIRSENGTSEEIVFHNYGTGKLRIESPIIFRSGSNPVSYAGTGVIELAGTNTYRGISHISGATVAASANANFGDVATGAGITFNGGTLKATDTFALDNSGANIRAISVGNRGATFAVDATKALTVRGVLGGANNGIVTKTGTGTLTLLDGVSTYTGRTYVNEGTLAVSGSGSINSSTGLYINGGTVSYNSSAALTAPVTFVAGTLKGTGTIGTAVTANTGDIVAPGNSVGAQTYNAGLTLAGGGTYQWELSDATGAEGNSSGGWDILNVTGGLGITATTGSKFSIEILSLTPANAAGLAANFNPAVSAQWRIANADTTIDNFDPNKFLVIATGFANLNDQPTRWSVRRGDQVTGGDDSELYITYVVPEPASLSLLGAAGMLFLARRRQQQA